MKEIRMEYHFQGKSDAWAEWEASPGWLAEKVTGPLEKADKVDVEAVIRVFDREDNHLATGYVTWQVKDWGKVKTKI